jgi:hypothetical protein
VLVTLFLARPVILMRPGDCSGECRFILELSGQI